MAGIEAPVRYEQRLPGADYEQMVKLAEENDRTLNAEVRRAVRLYLEQMRKLGQPDEHRRIA